VPSVGYFGVSDYGIGGYGIYDVLDDVRSDVKGSVGV
jgi:hypothetical protein